jgi:hypothetical protein
MGTSSSMLPLLGLSGTGQNPSRLSVNRGTTASVNLPGERTSLKERAGVKGGSACSFASAEWFAGMVN